MKTIMNMTFLGRLLTSMFIFHALQSVTWAPMVSAMDDESKKLEGKKEITTSSVKNENLRSYPTVLNLNETDPPEQESSQQGSESEKTVVEGSSSQIPEIKVEEAAESTAEPEGGYTREEQPMENVEEEEAVCEAEQQNLLGRRNSSPEKEDTDSSSPKCTDGIAEEGKSNLRGPLNIENKNNNNPNEKEKQVEREENQVPEEPQQVEEKSQQEQAQEPQRQVEEEEQGKDNEQKDHQGQEQQLDQKEGQEQEKEKATCESGIDKFRKVVRKLSSSESFMSALSLEPENASDYADVSSETLGDTDMCGLDEISEALSLQEQYEQKYEDVFMEKEDKSSSGEQESSTERSSTSDDEKVVLVSCTIEDRLEIINECGYEESSEAKENDSLRVATKQPIRLPPLSVELEQLALKQYEEDKEHMRLHKEKGIKCAGMSELEDSQSALIGNGPVRTHRRNVCQMPVVVQGQQEGQAQQHEEEQDGQKGEEEGEQHSQHQAQGQNCQCEEEEKRKFKEEEGLGKNEEQQKVYIFNRNNIVDGPEELIDAILGENIKIMRSTALLLHVWPVDYGNSRQVARIMNMDVVDEKNLLGRYYRIKIKGQEGGSEIPLLIDKNTADEIMKRMEEKRKIKEEKMREFPEIKIPNKIRKRAVIVEEGKIIYQTPMSIARGYEKRDLKESIDHSYAKVNLEEENRIRMKSKTENTPGSTDYRCMRSIPEMRWYEEGVSQVIGNIKYGDEVRSPGLSEGMGSEETTSIGGTASEEKADKLGGELSHSRLTSSAYDSSYTHYKSQKDSSPDECGASGYRSEGNQTKDLEHKQAYDQLTSPGYTSLGYQPGLSESMIYSETTKTPENYVTFEDILWVRSKISKKQKHRRVSHDDKSEDGISDRTTPRIRRRLTFTEEAEVESEENMEGKERTYKRFTTTDPETGIIEAVTSESDMSSLIRSGSSCGGGIVLGEFSEDEMGTVESQNEEASKLNLEKQKKID